MTPKANSEMRLLVRTFFEVEHFLPQSEKLGATLW